MGGGDRGGGGSVWWGDWVVAGAVAGVVRGGEDAAVDISYVDFQWIAQRDGCGSVRERAGISSDRPGDRPEFRALFADRWRAGAGGGVFRLAPARGDRAGRIALLPVPFIDAHHSDRRLAGCWRHCGCCGCSRCFALEGRRAWFLSGGWRGICSWGHNSRTRCARSSALRRLACSSCGLIRFAATSMKPFSTRCAGFSRRRVPPPPSNPQPNRPPS